MSDDVMLGWQVRNPGPIPRPSPTSTQMPVPLPGPGQLRVRVSVGGVCRTDLHIAEGDLPARRPQVIPGEIVGVVDASGVGSCRFDVGDRVGIAWRRDTCGVCRWCRSGAENLRISPRFTGWYVNGGYAEYAVVDEAYAYAIPEVFDDMEAAPLLCAGIIGYRALRRSDLPSGGRLGIYGFGGSAHLSAQVALLQVRRCT